MMILAQYKYPAIAAIALVGALLSGIKGYSLGVASVRAELIAAQEVARDKEQLAQSVVNSLSATLVAEIGKIRITNKTINKEIEREIHTKHVFSDSACDLPESTFRLLNDKAKSINAGVIGGSENTLRPNPSTD